jgi:beta-aspartyl-peptidase (threonine type)
MSKSGLDLLAEDLAPDSACEGAVRILKERVDGLGGLIMVDTKGRIGFAYNTPRMAFAYHEGLTGRSFAGVRR